jgi:hypothetical protein
MWDRHSLKTLILEIKTTMMHWQIVFQLLNFKQRIQPERADNASVLPSELTTLTEVIAPPCPSNIWVHSPAAFHTLKNTGKDLQLSDCLSIILKNS